MLYEAVATIDRVVTYVISISLQLYILNFMFICPAVLALRS